MNRWFIPVLIGLISLSLIGLIAIQIYWIRNSIALRDAQFRRNVRVALAEVNDILERDEKIHRLKNHEFGKLILQYDSIRVARQAQEIPATEKPVMDTLFLRSPTAESDAQTYIGDQSTIDRLEASYSEEKKSIELQIRQQYAFSEAQSKEIARLIFDLSTLEFGSNYLNRITSSEMDSLIKTSLKEIGGINARYVFGIFDPFDQPLLIPEGQERFIPEILGEGYKIRLLPSDYVNPTTFLHIWFPAQETYLLKTLWPLLVSSSLFMLAIILAFTYTIRTIVRQKKISEIKNDFINNMTHELKTPISTISLACEALADPSMLRTEQKIGHFVGMIRDENKRLGILVENVLRSAVLDRKSVELEYKDVNLHEVIKEVIHNIELQAEIRGGRIDTHLGAARAVVKGDRIHLTNVIYNLIDNAIKYSKDAPQIEISTKSDHGSISISVADRGIGIKKDDQKRIFEKLYRVPTGNVHNIKGFGLGLSYVKAIIEKHYGTISVESDFGKGSTFTIQLPFEYEL